MAAVSTGEHVLAPVQQRGQAALGRLGLPTRKQEALATYQPQPTGSCGSDACQWRGHRV
jgi:hypothetical protein